MSIVPFGAQLVLLSTWHVSSILTSLQFNRFRKEYPERPQRPPLPYSPLSEKRILRSSSSSREDCQAPGGLSGCRRPPLHIQSYIISIIHIKSNTISIILIIFLFIILILSKQYKHYNIFLFLLKFYLNVHIYYSFQLFNLFLFL